MPEDILNIIEEAIQHFRPGGEFAGVRAEQLAEKKATIVPEMRAELVGRGLAGTTVGAAIPGRFEREVAKPWRTETEMLRSARLMESILAKAGFAERAETRQSTEALAREEMALRERLQDEAISAQERNAAEQRLHEIEMQRRSGAGGGRTTPWGSYGAVRDEEPIPWSWERGAGGAGAGADAGGVGQHLGAFPSPFDGGAIPEGWKYESGLPEDYAGPAVGGGTWSPPPGPGEPGYDPSMWTTGAGIPRPEQFSIPGVPGGVKGGPGGYEAAKGLYKQIAQRQLA